MKLMTSQSLPPSSASSVMIMSHSIDLAGLAHRKNSLTLHCFPTWNSNQSDKLSPLYPPGFHTKQVSHPLRNRPGLSADTLKDSKPPGFFRLHWLVMPMFKQKLSGHLLAKSHRYIYIYIYIYIKEIRDTAKHRLDRYVPLRRVWFSRFLLALWDGEYKPESLGLE